MRLTAAALALTAAIVVVVASPSGAIGPSGGAFGGDRAASGVLLGDGAAEVSARDGSDLGDPRRPRRGGGNVVCRYYDDATGEPVDFSSLPEDREGIMVLRDCSDSETGEYVSIGLVPAGNRGNPSAEAADLARMARSRLPLPLPEARMNPDGEQTVNVPTWLWVDNWEPQSRTASAGGVTATVTAMPVEQRWTFGAPAERVVCQDAGTPYDLGRPAGEQSTNCSYTFRHSSAGQRDSAYLVTATIVWHVTWSSNIGASGDLGFVSRTTTIPTRVAEHQALNDSRSTP